MRAVFLSFAAVFALFPVAASAQDTELPSQQAPAGGPGGPIVVTGERAKPEKPEKRVCQRSVPTGSLRPKTVCRTLAQIELDRERSVVALEQARSDREMRNEVELHRKPN